jgi:hypothetical protein
VLWAQDKEDRLRLGQRDTACRLSWRSSGILRIARSAGADTTDSARELREALIERDEAEVQDEHAVAEVLESGPAPGALQRGDGPVPGIVVVLAVRRGAVGLADRGGVADGDARACGESLDRCPGEQGTEAEAPPRRDQLHVMQDEDLRAANKRTLTLLPPPTQPESGAEMAGQRREAGRTVSMTAPTGPVRGRSRPRP